MRARTDIGGLLGRHASVDEMKYVFEVRRALEMEAVRLACERRSDDDVRILRELATKRDVPAENFVDVDLAFHIAVVDAAHNPVLKDLFAGILETVRATYEVTEGGASAVADVFASSGSCRSHRRTRCHQSQGCGVWVSREDSGSDRFRLGGYRVRASANRLSDPAMSSAPPGVVIVSRSPQANVMTTAGPVRVTTP